MKQGTIYIWSPVFFLRAALCYNKSRKAVLHMAKRGRDIVIKSQFNINGSRGKSVGNFISGYVTRDAATDASLSWIPPTDRPPVQGDGVAFTLDSTAISRDETLALADHVENLFQRGDRAIQQMVFSFSPEYLEESGIIPEGIDVLEKGAYKYKYDDVRLRHAVQAGVHAMCEHEKYCNPQMAAAIQSDTMHLHVHAVVWEDGMSYSRKRGREEKGVIKGSSLNKCSSQIKRSLESTKDLSCVPTQQYLTPFYLGEKEDPFFVEEPEFVNEYLRILEEMEKEQARAEQIQQFLEL